MHAHRSLPSLVFTFSALGACTSSDGYVIVTVAARPAVRDAKNLTVTLTNGGTTRMDTLALRDEAFPVTFSISTPGRTGDLAITVDATDDAGLIVGHGAVTTTTTTADASLALEPADFVVNTDFANDQFPSSDFESSGFQLAAMTDGTWTAAFRDSCMAGSCSMFARRFDPNGKPVQTAVSASSNAFNLTTTLTTGISTPAIASSATTTLAVWDASEVVGGARSVACRSLDSGGRATPNQLAVATDSADVVSIAALANGNFVASWNATVAPDNVIRAVIIKPDCTVALAAQAVSTVVAASFPHRSAVASSADRVLIAWILDGAVHTRMALTAGTLLGVADLTLVPKPAAATDEAVHVRVAGVANGGFVMAVRWAKTTFQVGDPGRIELFRINSAGGLIGTPILITDKSSADFDNREAFSIASRPDGTLLVAWHTCGTLGDGSMCGVFGRILRDTGDPVTDVFTIPTTTDGDQKRPSVVGLPDAFVAMWTDASAKPPDVAGLAVRARIIYPPGPAAGVAGN